MRESQQVEGFRLASRHVEILFSAVQVNVVELERDWFLGRLCAAKES